MHAKTPGPFVSHSGVFVRAKTPGPFVSASGVFTLFMLRF